MSYQPRCSTEREPSTAEALFCMALLIDCIVLFVVMWSSFADEFAQWAIAQVARAYPH